MVSKSPAKKTAFDGKATARKLPTGPGVYLMKDASDTALYVGKAANLRKRVSSYFDARPKGDRIMRMVSLIRAIDVSLTRNEGEALLLENEWIKSLKPRYNILLRDDKSYPWIRVTRQQDFPRIAFHRGGKKEQEQYFGPYPSAGAVRESINLIQKLFRLRNCEDSYFKHRRRPCLQYQIKRCSAPCVDMISKEDYGADVQHALLFLQGRNDKVLDDLIARMERAAARQAYEQAAQYRDQINTLKQMQAQQFVSAGSGDADVIAVAQHAGASCVQLMSFRGGRNLGQRSYYPTGTQTSTPEEVMSAFLGQYFRERIPPALLLLSHLPEEAELLQSVFSERAERKVVLQSRPRGERRQWLKLTESNADNALKLKLASQANLDRQFEILQSLLNLEQTPQHIECFDISHTAGNQTVGSCVVFDQQGAVKSRYRRFNLKNIIPGDDYGAMKQVLERRYSRLQAEEGQIPDLIVIDGGKGQLKMALEVLEDLSLNDVPVLGIAKGPSRRAGHEEWVLPHPPYSLIPGPESPASHLLQQIRDEAHRFAITGHRGRRQKAAVKSGLEAIPGIGAKRRRALLNHFGGLQGVVKAGVEELASVPGINQRLAEEIFRALH